MKIAQEVVAAYDILKDPVRRTRYHNLFDKSGGGCSWYNPKKYYNSMVKAVYWPDVSDEKEEEERKQQLIKRLLQTLISLGLFGGGLVICAMTGGLALAPMIAGSTIGFGMIGAGMSGASRSRKEECTWQDWGISTSVGFAAGALTGGVVGGATAGIIGSGVALSSATIGQQVCIGTIAGSIGGASQSLANDAEQNLIDGKEIGAGKMLTNALCSSAVGTVVGAAGGAITSKVGGFLASTDADEVVAAALLRKSGVSALQSFSESGIGTILNSTKNAIEERLDPNSENRAFGEYVTDTVGGLVVDLVGGVVGGVAAVAVEVKKGRNGLDSAHETCTPKLLSKDPKFQPMKSSKTDRETYQTNFSDSDD